MKNKTQNGCRLLTGACVLLAGMVAGGEERGRPKNPDNLELVKRIREKIVKRSGEKGEGGEMGVVTVKVPLSGNAEFRMVPIRAGEFVMGSGPGEKDRREDEGPEVKVKVDAFWMSEFEATWDTFLPWVESPVPRYKDGAVKGNVGGSSDTDAVSGPTSPYTDVTYGMGTKGYPVISMTEHAALKYCQWLSVQTGMFFRLPTEAEWEYAARAGTKTAWHFGDDARQLGEYAWYFDNSEAGTHPVGRKKPNPWGLYDMHGNVAEWTLDQYDEGWYGKEAAGGVRENPFLRPVTLYPRSVRGGSWDDDAKDCRSAARRKSTPQWKQQDPQLPKSLWYHTATAFLGFRVVSPAKLPSAEEMHAIWNLGAVGAGK